MEEKSNFLAVREDRTAKFEKANPEAMKNGGTTHFGNRGLESLLKIHCSAQMPSGSKHRKPCPDSIF